MIIKKIMMYYVFLCIYTYLHNEGICYYLLQNDYKVVEQYKF
jgi:hypothetical protein